MGGASIMDILSYIKSKKALSRIKKVFEQVDDWESGTIYTNGTEAANWSRIRTPMLEFKQGDTIELIDKKTYDFAFIRYDESGEVLEASAYLKVYKVPADGFYRVVIKRVDESSINTMVNEVGKQFVITPNQSLLKKVDDVNEYQEKARQLLYKFEGTLGQSICFVGDELWGFLGNSSNDRTTSANCYRYVLDYDNETITQLGTFTQNWGHCNTIDYNAGTDSLILGSGTDLQSTSGYGDGSPRGVYLLPNASTFSSMSDVPLETNGIIINLENENWGRQIQAVWGEDNNRKYNICYVYSNDGVGADDTSKRDQNMYIRKVLLGQGANQLSNGTFISGKAGLDFNGTYEVLGVYEKVAAHSPHEAHQDGDFYNGILYTGLGHDGIWIGESILNEDGTIDYVRGRKEHFYADDGSPIDLVTQAMTIKDDKIYIRVYDYESNSADLHVYRL